MDEIRLTEAWKIFEGVKVYRIEAIKDIVSLGVKAGDMGGLVCKNSTLSTRSWVDKSSVVINSSLNRTSVKNNSVVQDSTLENVVVVDSKMYNTISHNSTIMESITKRESNINHTRIETSVVEKSTFECKLGEEGADDYVFRLIDSEFNECTLQSEGKGEFGEQCFFSEAKLFKSVIIGKDIKVIRVSEEAKTLVLVGETIRLTDMGTIKDLTIAGSDIELNKMLMMDRVRLKAEKLLIDGYGASTMHAVRIDIRAGRIVGKFDFNSVDFQPKEKAGLPSTLTISASPVEIKNSEFSGETSIKGDHLISGSQFQKGISLEGKSELTKVSSYGENPELSGDIIVGYTIIVGKKNVIRDYVKVWGRTTNPIQLNKSVTISEFCVIDNTSTDKQIILNEETVRGETIVQ
ncbi:hypothetical protein [Rossellomorea marisflavi]|uniref:hypothetical protein n=1 Tax=Rossellomorea marisflavi TaxID=189381 RepID=UPI003F9F3EDC